MNVKLYNLKKLNEISMGDHAFVRDMLATFVENVSRDIKLIQSLQLTEDWTAIAETSHKLASNFAYLGATKLHDLAAEIEKNVINDNNLTGIAEKTVKLCHEGTILVNQVNKDFFS